MKLWHLQVKDNRSTNSRWGWDCAYAFVIRAKSSAAARRLAASRAGDEKDRESGHNPWLDPKATTCEVLTLNGEEELIIRDFLAG